MSKLSRFFALTRHFSLTLAISFPLSLAGVSAAEEAVESEEASSEQQVDAASPAPSPWPVRVTDNGRTFLIYQPQIDNWGNNRLEGRSAVSVRNDASGQQNFGVLYFSARTELDQANRMVTVRDAAISKADFPAVTGGVDD